MRNRRYSRYKYGFDDGFEYRSNAKTNTELDANNFGLDGYQFGYGHGYGMVEMETDRKIMSDTKKI